MIPNKKIKGRLTRKDTISRLGGLTDICRRLTFPRLAVLGVLCDCGRHMTAEQIFKAALRKCPGLGLSTVYRNLDLLVDAGIVLKFLSRDNKSVYEIAARAEGKHHHHLICKKCKSIIDYSDSADSERDFIKKRQKRLSKKYDFKIERHFVDFIGLCAKCAKK
jgi:Fur family ferric uptake transcriptional regulator